MIGAEGYLKVVVIDLTLVLANEMIMREATTGDDMFFICSGVVEVYISFIKHASYLAIGGGCVSGNEDEHFFTFSSSVAKPVLLRFFPHRLTVFRRGFHPAGRETDGLGEVEDAVPVLPSAHLPPRAAVRLH